MPRFPRPIFTKTTLLALALLGVAAAGFAQSLRFDGKNDRLVLRNSERRLSAETFTLEAWVRSPHWRNAWFENTLVSTDSKPQRRGFAFAAGGRPGGAGQLGLGLYVRGAWTEIVSPPLLDPNRWYHVAAVVQQTAVRLYVDGREVTRAEVLPGYAPSDQPLQLGNTTREARCLNGTLDEVRVWNRARTAAELQRDRTARLRGDEPGLLAYFSMEKSPNNQPKNGVANGIEADWQRGGGEGWGPDHAPVQTDVGVEQIDGPDAFGAQEGPRRIQVTVRNHGTAAVGAVPLVYRLDGREVLRDTLRATLPAGASAVHKTRVPVDCLPGEASRLEVFTALPNDGWANNDTAHAAYRRLGNSRRVVVFDSVLHDFGAGGVEWFQFRRAMLPHDNARFSRILMHVNLACTSKGCDEWDRVGQVFLLKGGERYELGRFITPYGKPCGPWTLDVTDFRSVLRGHCLLESFVHLFTLKGWLLTVSFEFLENGPNPHPHHKITPLWQTDELIYGDARYATRLPTVRFQPSPRTRVLTFRHTITGLGQGNTDGAGEFARKTHRLVLKRESRTDSTVIPHLLWRSDCAQNPCTSQRGSYAYSRAGWCPGREVLPFTVNLPANASALTLDYHLQPYQNRLASGYDDGKHTEPHFWLHSYLIEKSDSLRGFTTYTNVRSKRVEVVRDPVADGQVRVWVANTGTTPVRHLTLRCFAGGRLHTEERVALSLNPGEEKAVLLAEPLPPATGQRGTVAVLTDLDADENAGDDVAASTVP